MFCSVFKSYIHILFLLHAIYNLFACLPFHFCLFFFIFFILLKSFFQIFSIDSNCNLFSQLYCQFLLFLFFFIYLFFHCLIHPFCLSFLFLLFSANYIDYDFTYFSFFSIIFHISIASNTNYK